MSSLPYLLTLSIIVIMSIVTMQADLAYAHFFGATKNVDNYQIVFSPSPSNPVAGSNSTLFNFSVLENGTNNISNIQVAVIVAEKGSGAVVGQIPYKAYEFSDFTIPYSFQRPGDYVVTLQTRIIGDEKYQATPLVASFDIRALDPNQLVPFDELMLFYVTPAAVVITGIAVYLHSKNKL